MEFFANIAPAVIGGLTSAAIAYHFFGKQKLIELRNAYDQELRGLRLRAYQELWKTFEPLAQFSPEQDVTYGNVFAIAAAMRSWYFKQGGLVLTPRARDLYMAFQETVDRMAAAANSREDVIRPRVLRLSREDMRRRLKAMSFELSQPPLRTADWSVWIERVERKLASRAFGVNAEDDFLVLQSLASRLRTLLTLEIRTREPSALEEKDLDQRP